MGAFIIRRLFQGMIVIILVTMLAFFAQRLMPGDPVMMYLSQNEIQVLTQEQIDVYRVEFGLDKPILTQYFKWVNGLLHGELGKSITYQTNINTMILNKLPITIYIGIPAFILSIIFGPLLGTICAIRRGTAIDSVLTVVANVGITAPSFWLGILLIYFLGVRLNWLPLQGYISPFTDFWSSIKHIILPTFCLMVAPLSGLTRQTRSAVLEVFQQDYIRTAWAKGLTERVLVLKHVIKNAFIPVITLIGMQVGMIFGGSVLIETVFNIPGIGRMLVSAVSNRDYLVVQAGALLMAVIVMLTNLIVDISYGWFDPRIRYR
jgi:peptide/nickel transport system permease protein